MNIFYTDLDPTICAMNLDTKRVIKMTLESCQILMTALAQYDIMTPYRPTHKNHPCCIWARETLSNYNWLYIHFMALCKEFTFRNKNNKMHSCQKWESFLASHSQVIPPGDLTPHPNCSMFKDMSNTIDAYRLTMIEKWKKDKKVSFSPRIQPFWCSANYI